MDRLIRTNLGALKSVGEIELGLRVLRGFVEAKPIHDSWLYQLPVEYRDRPRSQPFEQVVR